MKLVLIGMPGAGKSTQGNLLSKLFNIPYLSTGHIFREIAKEKTQLGRYVKETMGAGLLIPDEKTIEIVDDYLARSEYKRGYILDGFPRTLNQAKKFKNSVDKVIYLEIPDKEALWRLASRNNEERNDDTIKAIKTRIEIFHTFTKPVIEYYNKQGKMATIVGTRKIPEVNQEILKNLGKQLIKNQLQSWKRKNKSIIAVVGLPGAGKTEAAEFLATKKLPVVTFGKIINETIEKDGSPHTEELHKKLRESLRKQYGYAAMAILNEKKIKEALKNAMIIIIDGLRSWEEYLYLKKKFPSVQIHVLCIYADKELRYQRSNIRKYRSALYGEERDINELLGTNMGSTLAFSDFLVKNNFSTQEFHDKLEEVYRKVYFA